MKTLHNKLRKKYNHLKRSYLPSSEKPKRLIIDKAKWLNNADSPVMLMIDDFTNAWHSRNSGGSWDIGGDWGGGLDKEGSAFSFLEENLLKDFPEVKVTFFTVAGKISQYTFAVPFTFSESLNHSDESRAFFRKLHEDEKSEIAYHGYNHGAPGEKTVNFMQEWKGFRSVDEACEQTEKGKEIFKDVFGEYPRGGKYGGWEYNEFADASIARSGFLWWCRDWMPRDISDSISDSYYEPQFFGGSFVVALPSTVHGYLWDKGQIERLLEKQQIISIEEHIAPVRPDGLIQTPNVIDDIDELKSLFNYLRNKKVWYATGTEIAKYFIAYSFTTIHDIEHDRFKIKYDGHVREPMLTVIVDCRSFCEDNKKPAEKVILPDGKKIEDFAYLDNRRHIIRVNIPVQNGPYQIQ
ncbi:MAG: hypothetical protein C4526_06205 [Nitrospiraceae bacterium]|nr:MAG: hypothetical protein C4526_06205 [Nitrospiraceae bacterium]